MDIEAIVNLRPTFIPPQLRLNDTAIIDILLTNDHPLDDIKWSSFRWYKNVKNQFSNLREICNVNGTHLVDGIGDGNIANLECTPMQEEIYQPYPTTKSWFIWNRLLQFVAVHFIPNQLNYFIVLLKILLVRITARNAYTHQLRAYILDKKKNFASATIKFSPSKPHQNWNWHKSNNFIQKLISFWSQLIQLVKF